MILNSNLVFESELLRQLPWLMHGFATQVSKNWPPAEYTNVKQIHSAFVVDANGGRGQLCQGDGLITSEPENVLGVRTADCVPILMADTRRRVVAAVHAGWRGTVAEITRVAVEQMKERHGTHPGDLVAAIGPSIEPCCFEVGPEVAREFERWLPGSSHRRYLDLVEVNRKQLRTAGVRAGQIDASAPCTVCRVELLHSFRRDKEHSGRMVSAIGIRPSSSLEAMG